MQKVSLYAIVGCILLTTAACLPTYGEKAGGRVDLSSGALHTYLKKAELARPETVRDVLMHLRRGERFRKRILDQRSRWTLATVWVEQRQQNVLHVVTSRNETCPVCGGTGKRKWSNESMKKMSFDTRCLRCDGKGYLEHHTMERKFVLTPRDFENTTVARQTLERTTLANAPEGTRQYIEMLNSKVPQQRLNGCLWLDKHYIRKGATFQDVLPMLRKARWHEKSEKKNLLLWQFHAGKGLPGEHNRAYYRIYADSRTGKIVEKGFYPAS